MALTNKEKAANKRKGMIEKAREYQIGTYSAEFTAKDFQKMIRAEAAALPAGPTPAIVDGELIEVYRNVGQCVCVSCGVVYPWNTKKMHAGHFLASRRASILYEEDNVHPQCNRCNTYDDGNPQAYRLWMELVYGKEVIERLRRLKNTTVSFSRDELVDMRIGYAARLKAAEEKMKTW